MAALSPSSRLPSPPAIRSPWRACRQPDCAEARLTFPGFLGAFATYIIESLSITHATIAETVQKIMLENAPTMRRLEQVCDTSQLRTTKAAAVLKKERTTVQQVSACCVCTTVRVSTLALTPRCGSCRFSRTMPTTILARPASTATKCFSLPATST